MFTFHSVRAMYKFIAFYLSRAWYSGSIFSPIRIAVVREMKRNFLWHQFTAESFSFYLTTTMHNPYGRENGSLALLKQNAQ